MSCTIMNTAYEHLHWLIWMLQNPKSVPALYYFVEWFLVKEIHHQYISFWYLIAFLVMVFIMDGFSTGNMVWRWRRFQRRSRSSFE